jgi:hypothetical protein
MREREKWEEGWRESRVRIMRREEEIGDLSMHSQRKRQGERNGGKGAQKLREVFLMISNIFVPCKYFLFMSQ